MDQAEVSNPYRAPDASIAALSEEIRRPPVHTAISLFCWAVGAFHLVACVLLVLVTTRNVARMGIEVASRVMQGRVTLLILVLGLSATFAYFTAARWLRNGRSSPGLIVCVVGMAMTYLVLWLLNG